MNEVPDRRVIIEPDEIFEPARYDHHHGVQRHTCLICEDQVVDKREHLIVNHYAEPVTGDAP